VASAHARRACAQISPPSHQGSGARRRAGREPPNRLCPARPHHCLRLRARAELLAMSVFTWAAQCTGFLTGDIIIWSGVTAHDKLRIPCEGLLPGNRTCRYTESHLARDFCFPPSGRELTQQMGQCRGRTHVPMALCEPRRQRPCHRDRDEQAMQTDTRMAHVKRAPGNMNVAAQRAVAISSTVVAEGTIGSLGARYV
jgi:hypothetical protein